MSDPNMITVPSDWWLIPAEYDLRIRVSTQHHSRDFNVKLIVSCVGATYTINDTAIYPHSMGILGPEQFVNATESHNRFVLPAIESSLPPCRIVNLTLVSNDGTNTNYTELFDPIEVNDAGQIYFVVYPKNRLLNDVSYYFKVIAIDIEGLNHTIDTEFILRVGCPPEASSSITFVPLAQTFPVNVSKTYDAVLNS